MQYQIIRAVRLRSFTHNRMIEIKRGTIEIESNGIITYSDTKGRTLEIDPAARSYIESNSSFEVMSHVIDDIMDLFYKKPKK